MSQAILLKTTKRLGCLKPFGSRENPAWLWHELLLKTRTAQTAKKASQILKDSENEQQSMRTPMRDFKSSRGAKRTLET